VIPVCEGRGGFGKSVDELAIEYVMLQSERPKFPIRFQGQEPIQQSEIDARRDHMHQEYLRYEEMIRRTGLDRTIVAINQAKDTLRMMGIEL
jgi:hypothetical protein